jgi:hypothetical protein
MLSKHSLRRTKPAARTSSTGNRIVAAAMGNFPSRLTPVAWQLSLIDEK